MLLKICLLLIGINILNALYFLTCHYRGSVQPFRVFSDIFDELQIVNIGSGPALFAFDWESANIRGLNLAVWPEDFRYDYKMLRHFFGCRRRQCQIVILGISILSFAKNKYLASADFSERYVHILPQQEVELSAYKYYLEKYFPLLSRPRRIKPIIKMLLHMEEPYKMPFCEETEEDVKRKLADEMIHGWICDNPPLKDLQDISTVSSFAEDFLVNRKNVDSIYDYCQEKGFECYAVVCPVSEYIRTQFSQAFLDKFLYENLQKLKIPKDHILLHLDDNEFAGMENYLNGLFLTKSAQSKFTYNVIDELGL